MHNSLVDIETNSPICGESAISQHMRSIKLRGAYYTPDAIAESLVRWAVHQQKDHLLDPACGDGRFLSVHKRSTGVESDSDAVRHARDRVPSATIHNAEFFSWAARTPDRFECAAGNPPFIRYQSFRGDVRRNALALCAQRGAQFTGLTSSWAPFLVATASLLKPGGRMAFVVPAEIGHAPYARPLLQYLISHFGLVHLIAVKTKIFPDLSEDCWLLYADDFGCSTSTITLTICNKFRPTSAPPKADELVDIDEWRRDWNYRIRPYFLPRSLRRAYREMVAHPGSVTLGEIADIGIGYVTGDNDFFHLRPSDAAKHEIPRVYLHPAVRNGRSLPRDGLNANTVENWWRNDEQMLLLKLPNAGMMPNQIQKYLSTDRAITAKQAFKCRTRQPWYSVPDVVVPDLFMSYMSGRKPQLVANEAGCVGTNSVHAVRLRCAVDASAVVEYWQEPFVELSCELEGHPLGGGMLKLEPREAARVCLPGFRTKKLKMEAEMVSEGIRYLREWRHVA